MIRYLSIILSYLFPFTYLGRETQYDYIYKNSFSRFLFSHCAEYWFTRIEILVCSDPTMMDFKYNQTGEFYLWSIISEFVSVQSSPNWFLMILSL